MNIQQILRWIIIAIVLVVAIMLLNPILQLAAWLFWLALKVVVVLLLLAIGLRFLSLLQQRRR